MKRQFEEKNPKGQAIGGTKSPTNGKRLRLTALGGEDDWRIQSGLQTGGNPLLTKIRFNLKKGLARGMSATLRPA